MRGIIDLEARHGLNYTRSATPVGAELTITQVKAEWAAACERLKTRGPAFLGRPLSDAELLQCTWWDLSWLNGIAEGQGGGQPIDGFLSSNNHIDVPWGTYLARIPAEFSSGEYNMQGAGYTEVNNDSTNTKLRIDHAGWLGNPARRNLLVSGSWGRTGNFGYVEGTRFHNFRIDGDQKGTPNERFESYGLMLWKPGEVTDSDRIYAENFRTSGIIAYAPTPTKIGNVSVFENVESGIRFAGSWGGTVDIDIVSGDNNGALFETTHMDMDGVTDEAGGCLRVGIGKNESMVASSGRTHRGQVVAVLRGQFAVEVMVHMAVKGGRIPAMFIVDSSSVNHPPQSSWLEVKGKGYQYDYLIHDIRAGKGVPSMGEYAGGRVEYYTDTQEYVHRGRPQQAVPDLATYRTAPRFGENVKNDLSPGALPYRHIIVGPPQQQDTVYLDDDPQPPACQWIVGTPGEWSTCTGGTRTRTTEYVSSVSGCTPPEPKPAPIVDTEVCTDPVDPTPTSGIDPSAVAVVVNTDDPSSEALAAAYVQAWGIPAGNVVRQAMGAGEDLGNQDQLKSLRSKLDDAGRQFTALCFSVPSRMGSQSITSAVTFGVRPPSDLTQSALYGYSGKTPRADVGAAPSWLVRKSTYIRRDAHGTRPEGSAILLLAKDGSTLSTCYRGNARSAQAVDGVTVWDSRNDGRIGPGENPCNSVSNTCYIDERTPVPPVYAIYSSMYKLVDQGDEAYLPGMYADHLTSFGGHLPTGNGQTPLTFWLDRGAALSVGTVSEPWQGGGDSPGALVEQFVDVRRFHPLFTDGLPVGIAAWASVKCPDRALFAGDGMCAVFASGTHGPGGSTGGSTGSTGPIEPGLIASYPMVSSTTSSLIAEVGADAPQPTGWKQASTVSRGQLTNTNGNAEYPVVAQGVRRIVFDAFVFMNDEFWYQVLMKAGAARLRFIPRDGYGAADRTVGKLIWSETGHPTIDVPGVFRTGEQFTLDVTFPSAMNITQLFGGSGSSPSVRFDALRLYS